MILKKPYAFLIKNFRKIHFILAILSVFIIIKTNTVVGFFKEYVANNYSVIVSDDLVSSTISNWLYVAIIVMIITLISVYVLLKLKKKPTKLYFFAILYYIILLIGIILASVLISSLSKGLWATASARTYRDFANIIYYPSYFFLIFLSIRALGFDVKKFNFKNDLKELKITEEDSEEIELSLNFQTYKTKRNLRRFARELKYYYLENKKIIYLIGVILIVFLGFVIYKNTEKLRYTYKENKTFSSSGMTYKIMDSMITNIDLKGNIIDENKYYIVIRFEVKNTSRNDSRINLNYIIIKIMYTHLLVKGIIS